VTLLYEGKAKKIYKMPVQHQLRVEFKNDLTAFNALKKGSFDGKGSINRDIASLIFRYLKNNGVASHWISDEKENEMIVQEVKIIPLEVVVRNILAGSTAKKLGIEEGKPLKRPLVEFYYKNDALGDPFLSEEQIYVLEISNPPELAELNRQALAINTVLIGLFQKINIQLIDFKIEFGKLENGGILLADEITPDCCRLWDLTTNEKLDKDRFRRDLGRVQESYLEVLNRLKEVLS
jgi:phosphoribosylaminoimidazole-succinocarboxamide synthase